MSFEAIHNLNVSLGFGVILLQIISVFTLLALLFFRKNKNSYLDFIDKYFLSIFFVIVSFSSFFPLVYSEIINYAPCSLCWWQRVFMFPLVFLFIVAFFEKDRRVVYYSFPLVIVGFCVSLYQNFFYYFGNNTGACDSSGVSCYQRLVSEFGGYISIPMMALSSFFALLVLLLVAHFYKKENLI